MKKRKPPPLQTPTDPCAYCNKPVEQFGWVVNGAGQLCHYPECFFALWKEAETRESTPTSTTADP